MHGVNIVAGKLNYIKSCIIIALLASYDLKWVFIIPIETIHATAFTFFNLLERYSFFFEGWIELRVVFFSAYMVRQYFPK